MTSASGDTVPPARRVTVNDLAASLGEQIRRLEQLQQVIREVARAAGLDWKDIVERTERRMWSETEREKLREAKP